MKILNLIFHNFVLISEFKYYLLIMQLRYRSRTSRSFLTRGLIIKSVVIILIFFLAIFLVDKINMPAPNKLIKQELSNDKLITVK